MKIISLLFICCVFYQKITAQNSSNTLLVRSTTSVVGASKKVTVNNKAYHVQQSVGQSSVIGTATANGKYILRQGFIQPNIWAKIIDKDIPLTLKVTAYPNPFTEGITVSFSDKITTDINIVLYDVLGRAVLTKKYASQQNIRINLAHLSIGNYLLKVRSHQQQIIKSILKK